LTKGRIAFRALFLHIHRSRDSEWFKNRSTFTEAIYDQKSSVLFFETQCILVNTDVSQKSSSSSSVSSRATVMARTGDVVSTSTTPSRTSNSWSAVDKPPPARPTAVTQRPRDAGGPRRPPGRDALAALDSLAAETRALSQTIHVNQSLTSFLSSASARVRPAADNSYSWSEHTPRTLLSTHGCLSVCSLVE